jgi:hypothetical protein
MKKTFILIGAFLLTLTFGINSNAQGPVPCVETLNQFFHEEVVTTMAEGASPKILNRLGTNPQFGQIKRHTAASAYAHLKGVKRRSKRNGQELDRLLRTLGYTGSEDPSFGVEHITPVIVPAGSVGWMGSGSTKYFKAQFGKDFEGFKIYVKEGPCFMYIMKTCGNIFFQDIPPCNTSQPCPECNNFSAWSNNNMANAYCNCTPCPECQTTIEQKINMLGSGKISSGDLVMDSKEVSLVATHDGVDLCMGTISVPVNVSYEYEATGSTSASQIVKVDNKEGNALAAVDLKIPVNLDFEIEASQTSFGNKGAIRMDVTAKRFAVLKKYYKVCPTDMTNSGQEISGLSATEIDQSELAITDAKGDGTMNLKKQTLFFSGNDAISEVVSKEHSNLVTVIAHSKKTGKLVKGESADRYLCLGQYNVAGASAIQYMLTGGSTLTHAVEICDKDGTQPSEKNINLPIDLKAAFTKQEMKVGDDGKVFIEITEAQYKKMGKRFSKCCTNGDEGCW